MRQRSLREWNYTVIHIHHTIPLQWNGVEALREWFYFFDCQIASPRAGDQVRIHVDHASQIESALSPFCRMAIHFRLCIIRS